MSPRKATSKTTSRTTVTENGVKKHREHKKRLKQAATIHKLVWRDVTCRVRRTPS